MLNHCIKTTGVNVEFVQNTLCPIKKRDTFIFVITLANIDQF